MRARPEARRHGRASRSSRRPAPTVWTSTIGSWMTRPAISRESVRRTRPPSTTHTSHEVPPMSMPTASPSPDSLAMSAAPTAPPAGPDSTLQAPARAASAVGATPPDDFMISGSGSPRSTRGPRQPREVAAEQGGEVGVDHGGRGALVLAELRQDLAGGRDVHVGELRAQALGERPLVGSGRGRRRAGRRRPTRRRSRAPRRPADPPHPSRAGRSRLAARCVRARRSAGRAGPAGPASARTGGIGRAGSGERPPARR